MDGLSFPVDDDFYRTLVQNASEGMLTIDENSRIVHANPAMEEILGYSPDELVGSSKTEIIPERLQSVHADALSTYVDSGDRSIDWDGIELPALHKDGHEVPTLISLREHYHDGERLFTGIIRDISERKQQEETLQQQRDRLDQFADILAHDIKNPLSVALGYAEIAQDEHDMEELDEVKAALHRMETLIDDVLSLSKAGDVIGDTGPVNVTEITSESWENTDTGDATLAVESSPGQIVADRARLVELLENLFRNSVEHSTTGDQTAGEGQYTGVTVEVGPLLDGSGFYVADDGPGIPEPDRAVVLDHGYSTREEGTGYGLSIVTQIAEAHGWSITVSESDSSGARFEFSGVDSV